MNRIKDPRGTKKPREDTEKKVFDHSLVEKLERLAGSPFYVFDLEKLRENYRKIDHAFRSRYEKVVIGYSYKTNYLPLLCKTLDEMGAYAEVVSRLEYDLALKIGVNPRKIIFNGPVKSKEDIFLALQNRSIVNLDSFYEIEHVKEYARFHKEEEVFVGLRISFRLSTEETLQEGYSVSRFGFFLEGGDVEKALEELSRIGNVHIHSLHCHFSTTDRSVRTFKEITQNLCQIANTYIPGTIEFIDVGGGIYGELPKSLQLETPSFEDYAEEICSTMTQWFGSQGKKPTLVLEPGMAMVANVFSYVTKVIEIKKNGNERFVVTNGSVHNVKPTMHKRNLPMTIINKNKENRYVEEFHIVGYTCMEKDYLAHKVRDVVPERGDYLLFENAGAYTIVFNPPFIMPRPAILAKDGIRFWLTRKRETFKQFFHEDLYQIADWEGEKYEHINFQCRTKG